MTDHRECRNCGRKHDYSKRENCPVFGKTCNKCRKPNHFAVKCRFQRSRQVRAIEEGEEDEEVYATNSGACVDESQYVTVQLDSGNYLRFQVDTGAQ